MIRPNRMSTKEGPIHSLHNVAVYRVDLRQNPPVLEDFVFWAGVERLDTVCLDTPDGTRAVAGWKQHMVRGDAQCL